MTLISSSVPLDTFYYSNNTLTHQNSTPSNSTNQALSWLHFDEPATGSTPTTKNNKYRTLASIQAQSLQQHLHLLNDNSDNLSPISPTSTKPSLLDTQSTTPSAIPITTTSIAPITKESTSHSITAALQAMDASHGTCFLTWIHNPTNLDYISLRLRPLCLEYPLVDVANVLRWIGADWSSTDCKALFRAVTSNWDQSKRRILAFLLIRDEEMRQKAKSKLVEFAQKSSTSSSRKSTQLRTPGSPSIISPQQQQQQHHQRIQPAIHYQQRIQQQQQQQQCKQVQQVQSVPVVVGTSTVPSFTNNNDNNDSNIASNSWRGGVNMTALENIAAASLITGIDMTLPLSTSSLLSTIAASGSAPAAVACASTTTTTTSANLYSRRFSPY